MLADMVGKADFPCMMAQAVFGHGHAHAIAAGSLENIDAENITLTLAGFDKALQEIQRAGRGYHSIVLEFTDSAIHCEHQFEAAMWRYLQVLHTHDARSYSWDERVSSNPQDANFSFSLRGKAFYIIGMHPASSRKARRAPYPTLVFNLHEQFEALRIKGTYHKVRDKIRLRDEAYSGSINPVLQDFGATSEARQYSGRNVPSKEWQCPFKTNH